LLTQKVPAQQPLRLELMPKENGLLPLSKQLMLKVMVLKHLVLALTQKA
jgi:hypothetical protein